MVIDDPVIISLKKVASERQPASGGSNCVTDESRANQHFSQF